MNPPERTILHVDMDAFFASIEQQMFPFLRGKPIGVCGDPDGRTVIAAASYEAKCMGVRTAMTLPEAIKLCPGIILVPGQPARYVDTSRRIIEYYINFTNVIDVLSVDEVSLDVTHTAHMFNTPEAIAGDIKRWLKNELGLTCSIGVAPSKMLAKLFGEMNKPNGFIRVRRSEVTAMMENIPVEQLCGIGSKTTTKLAQLGIHTCGQLGRFPEKWLVAAFGINGIRLKRMGQGTDEGPVLSCCHNSTIKSMGHSFTLPCDTNDPTMIQRHLLQLSEQVGRRLRKGRFAGRTVSLVLRYADFSTFIKQHSLKNYIDDGHRIYQVGLRLFGELYTPTLMVRLLGISVSSLVRNLKQAVILKDQRSGSLFPMLDDVNDKYGEFSVARAKIQKRIPSPRVISPSWRPDAPRL